MISIKIKRFENTVLEDLINDRVEAINVVIDNRIEMIKEANNIGAGYTFIFTDIFHKSDWTYLSNEFGNWHFGRIFSKRINSNDYPIERIENNKKGYAQYEIIGK